MTGTHRDRWIWLAVVGGVGMIAAFATIAEYPLPDIPGGWCQSGFVPHDYTVQTVTRLAMVLDVASALTVVVSAGAATGRLARGLMVSMVTAVPVGLLLLVTATTYIGRINCAFSG